MELQISHSMVKRYNEIFREQMPNITPHVCRHTYCSIQARAGMYPKTLQYLMGHSDISVTMNTYTHLGLEDAVDEMNRMQQLESARKEQEALSGKTDEDNLGFTYAALDEYLRTGVCEDESVKAKIDRLHKLNEFKLKPMPFYPKYEM